MLDPLVADRSRFPELDGAAMASACAFLLAEASLRFLAKASSLRRTASALRGDACDLDGPLPVPDDFPTVCAFPPK